MTQSSTAIEGNTLNAREVEALYDHKKINASKREIYEVENYLKTMRYIANEIKNQKKINEKTLLKIHKLVSDKTLAKEQSGKYRKKTVYVVRKRLGLPQEIMYTAPQAKIIPKLCMNLLTWLEKSKKEEINPVITAGIVHQEIAAIHPFADGNGRTARAFATLVLYDRGYDFRKLFALEDYYNHDRPAYYQAINVGKNYESRDMDFTSWLEYFVYGFYEEINNVKTQIKSLTPLKIKDDISSQIYLEKHQMMIIDFIDQMGRITSRDVEDILKCPKRTAQLYLQKLKKLKMIKQIGKGRAAAYILEK